MAAGVEQAIAEVKHEIAEVKHEISGLKYGLEDVKDPEERRLVLQRLAAMEQRLTALSQERLLLLQQQQHQQQQPGAAGSSSAAAAATAESIQATIKRRCTCSTKYAAHLSVRGPDGRDLREAATVVGPRHIATFAHAPHDGWSVGQEVQVSLHSGDGDRRRLVSSRVAAVDPHSDVAILEVNEELAAPVLDAAVSPGDHYYLHGQSTQAQADNSSISHGVISATELDQLSHIRGDIPSGIGDSGGGCFSVETGKLIAMNVGQDEKAHKAVLVPSATIMHMLAAL